MQRPFSHHYEKKNPGTRRNTPEYNTVFLGIIRVIIQTENLFQNAKHWYLQNSICWVNFSWHCGHTHDVLGSILLHCWYSCCLRHVHNYNIYALLVQAHQKILVLWLDVSMQVHIQEYKENTEFSPKQPLTLKKLVNLQSRGAYLPLIVVSFRWFYFETLRGCLHDQIDLCSSTADTSAFYLG